MRRCLAAAPEASGRFSGRCRSHRAPGPDAHRARTQVRPARRRQAQQQEPPPATLPAPASDRHRRPPGRHRAIPPARKQVRPAHRRRAQQPEPPPATLPAPASARRRGHQHRHQAAPPDRRQGCPARRPRPARPSAAGPAAAGKPARETPMRQRRKPWRSGRTIPWREERLMSVCRRLRDNETRQPVAPGRGRPQTASAAAPTRWRRAPITACCWASASSGKIGRLSTSAQSRSVIGRLPGP